MTNFETEITDQQLDDNAEAFTEDKCLIDECSNTATHQHYCKECFDECESNFGKWVDFPQMEHQEYFERPFPVQCKTCQVVAYETEKDLRAEGWSLSTYGEYCPKHADDGRKLNTWASRRARWTAYNNTLKKLGEKR